MSVREQVKSFRIKCQNAKDCSNEELFNGLETQFLTNLSAELLKDCPKDITDKMVKEGCEQDIMVGASGFYAVAFNQANKEWREYLQEKLK